MNFVKDLSTEKKLSIGNPDVIQYICILCNWLHAYTLGVKIWDQHIQADCLCFILSGISFSITAHCLQAVWHGEFLLKIKTETFGSA